MVKDRLHQLQAVIKSEDADYELQDQNIRGVTNTVVDVEHEEAGYMAHFFSEVELSRLWISNIKEHIKQIKSLHSALLSSPREDESMKLELEARNETVKQIAKKVNNNLKLLERGIVQEEDELENKGQLPAGLRIRKTQHATTLRLLIDAISEFNAEQVDYKEKCEERIQRVVSIAKAEITDEKLEELLEQGSYGSIFNGDIITETMEVKRTLKEVQIRHQELVKLEKSIMELKTLFVEMALLVEQQGDIINSIEHHVQLAGEAMSEAKIATKKAMIYQEKAKMKKLILLAIAAVFVLLILLMLYSKINSFLTGGDKETGNT
ncbi:syntaxin-1A-like [Planococcus citri]|uniref:syntaxin-1A-like n=1 Tax=Planococcus citri TaxID=170843 RepID=UPI0031F79FFF